MSSRRITIDLPENVLAYVQKQAGNSGISVEIWLLRELEVQRKLQGDTDRFFSKRAQQAVPGSWRDLLANRLDSPPIPGDELPELHHL